MSGSSTTQPTGVVRSIALSFVASAQPPINDNPVDPSLVTGPSQINNEQMIAAGMVL